MEKAKISNKFSINIMSMIAQHIMIHVNIFQIFIEEIEILFL